jgi:hypothetical protein
MQYLSFFRLFGVLWVASFVVGCQPQHRDRYLPSGWSLPSESTQLLARSYPRFDWITLILLPKQTPQHLFTAPLPPLQRAHSDDPTEKRPPFLPLLPWQPASPSRLRIIPGFQMDFRSNHPIHMACRLQFLTSEKVLRSVEVRFVLPASPRRWIKKRFLWSDFRPLPAQNNESIHPSATSQASTKARPSATSQASTKARPSATSQASTKARPSATSQSSTKAHPSATSQNSAKAEHEKKGVLQTNTNSVAAGKIRAVFSALDLRGGIAFWGIAPRKRSVTLTLRGPFGLSLPRRKHKSSSY